MNRANNAVKCRDVSRELILRFDEGSLDDLPGELRVHIEACSKCRRELEELIQLRRGLTGLPWPDPAPSFWTNFLPNLRRRMEQTAPPWRRKDLAWIPSLGLALIFALLLLKSPTRIAPPTWFEIQPFEQPSWAATTYGEDPLTDKEWEQLEKISESQDILDLYLNESETYLIDRLSEPYPYSYYDSIDRLTAMEDEAVSDFLEKLKAQQIIQTNIDYKKL